MSWRAELDVGNLTVENFTQRAGAFPQYLSAGNTNVLGTVGTGVTAVHRTNDNMHFMSVLTLAAIVCETTAAAAHGYGNLIYTFPAGAMVITGSYFNMLLTPPDADLDTDQPYMSLGTTEAQEGDADLTTTEANIGDKTQIADAFLFGTTPAGFAAVKTSMAATGVGVEIETGGTKTVYANYADTWAAIEAAMILSGTVMLEWTRFTEV